MERNSGEDGDSSAASSEWNDVRLECAVADAGHPRAALRWAGAFPRGRYNLAAGLCGEERSRGGGTSD